ncbi:class F sortase [Kitasatospora sp. NBC_00315]|uniref:class F sortase n=1 Tax=Kitasatospora sp. NBC_00315 TaxID=2975963 RepID=UPI00324FF7B3
MTGSPATPRRPSSATEDGRPRRARHRRRVRLAAGLVLLAGLSLAGAGARTLLAPSATQQRPADFGELPPDGPGAAPSAGPATLSAAPPVRVRIPGIGLDDPLTDLHVEQDGHLAAPADPDQVGWWSEGPRPGDSGAAIIVGHVDSLTGPAAFAGLSALRPGNTITVDRSDLTTVTFTVQALRQYDKAAFPDDQVYTDGGAPQLRLITCSGTYDRAQHEYPDNLVVYASLTTPPPPPSTPSPASAPTPASASASDGRRT